ncbi:bric a brac 1 isoform 2-T2 [Glossina fuscipes fuscipes]
MSSNTPLPTLPETGKKGKSPSISNLMDTTTDNKQPSRPSSVIPGILASLDSNSPSPPITHVTKLESNSLRSRNEHIVEVSSVSETPSHVPTPHSSSPVCEVPSSSPHSEQSSSGSASASAPQQFCLRWNNYQSNLTSVFDQLLQTESFVDVTLACDGHSIKAHKMVLSACSPYFQNLFFDTPCQHPIVIMRDVGWCELKAIVDFMYKGEINVSQEQIGPLLRIAEMLKVRGLADVGNIESSTSDARPNELLEKHDPSPQNLVSPKIPQHLSPITSREQSLYQSPDSGRADQVQSFLSFTEPNKKLRLEKSAWDINSSSSGNHPNSSSIELRLSPLPHGSLVSRNVRKRRWPSADALLNPPSSPLSGLIAAERAEQEQERERQREHILITPPIAITSSNTNSATHLTSSSLASNVQIEIPSSSLSLLPPARTPSGLLTPSPHLQISQHQSQLQQHHSSGQHSQRASPASSVASTQPSSVLSGPLTPSPANITSSNSGESHHRFSMGSVQAAAMAAAAAAAHIDLTPAAAMGIGSLPSAAMPIGSGPTHHPSSIADDLEIKPGIAEMIREEERAKMLESSHAWMSSGASIADSYQYQLQSMWQKCWNTNQSLMHHLRFRERGPLKSWRPETMAEAIFSVLKEGLSLSQAARKYDIPYPTFVLYANRVHNMLGPSIDGGPDLRPKGRGRPQRILLGIWPDEHIKGVIKTVVFRDAKDLKEETFAHLSYGRHSPVFSFQESTLNYGGPSGQCANGMPAPASDQMSQEATAAAVAAVAHNFRQQMQMAAAAQHQQHTENLGAASLFNLPPHLVSAAGPAGAGPIVGAPGPGSIVLPKPSISPALSTTSNSGGGSAVVGPRHAPSPCGPTLTGMHQLPPGMAVALHMVGGTGRCETATMLNQQQHQHQLQQLHMQQQHAIHQQQQQQQKHHQQMIFGASSISHPSISTATTAASASSQHSISTAISASQTKFSSSSISPSLERQRQSTPGNTALRSSLTDLGLDFGYSKSTQSFSPSRLFPDDLADLVGTSPSSSTSKKPSTLADTSSTITVTKSNTPSEILTSVACTSTTTSTTSNKSSSNSVKLEPITTSSE